MSRPVRANDELTSPDNRDGIWDREEIEAIYGVHHVYSQKKSKVGGRAFLTNSYSPTDVVSC